MDRLTRFETVHAVMPFLHQPDLTFLRHVSHTWKCISTEWAPRLTFYGNSLPIKDTAQRASAQRTSADTEADAVPLTVPLPSIPMASVLLARDYSLLQELLTLNIDRRYAPMSMKTESGSIPSIAWKFTSNSGIK